MWKEHFAKYESPVHCEIEILFLKLVAFVYGYGFVYKWKFRLTDEKIQNVGKIKAEKYL